MALIQSSLEGGAMSKPTHPHLPSCDRAQTWFIKTEAETN